MKLQATPSGPLHIYKMHYMHRSLECQMIWNLSTFINCTNGHIITHKIVFYSQELKYINCM
jgi:hypothetical protein